MTPIRLRRIVSFRKQVRWLERLPDPNLQIWLKKVLADRDPSPFPAFMFMSDNDHAAIPVMQRFRASKDRTFQHRFRCSVKALVRDWDFGIDGCEYLMNLLVIVGLAGISAARQDLVRLAGRDGGLLKGITVTQGDLHLLLLRVLLKWPPLIGAGDQQSPLEVDMLRICDRDLSDPRYATTCYRALYEARTDNGVDYLPRMLEATIRRPEADAQGVMRHFLLHQAHEVTEKLLYKGETMSASLQQDLAKMMVGSNIPFGRPSAEYVCWLRPGLVLDAQTSAVPEVVCLESKSPEALDRLWRIFVRERLKDPKREMRRLRREVVLVGVNV